MRDAGCGAAFGLRNLNTHLFFDVASPWSEAYLTLQPPVPAENHLLGLRVDFIKTCGSIEGQKNNYAYNKSISIKRT